MDLLVEKQPHPSPTTYQTSSIPFKIPNPTVRQQADKPFQALTHSSKTSGSVNDADPDPDIITPPNPVDVAVPPLVGSKSVTADAPTAKAPFSIERWRQHRQEI